MYRYLFARNRDRVHGNTPISGSVGRKLTKNQNAPNKKSTKQVHERREEPNIAGNVIAQSTA